MLLVDGFLFIVDCQYPGKIIGEGANYPGLFGSVIGSPWITLLRFTCIYTRECTCHFFGRPKWD